MNETIKLLQNRRSVREFTGEKIKDEDLKLILKTAQRAASSVNGQQISLIVVRDKDKLKKISELSHNQKHIEECDAFIFILADFYVLHTPQILWGKEMLVLKQRMELL